MAGNAFKKEIPDSVRDLNDTAEGLTSRENGASEFLDAANRVARRFTTLMREASTGEERSALMATFSTHIMQVANMPFDRNDSVQSLDAMAGVVKRLGDAFVMEAGPDTVPDHFTPDQLRYLAGTLKSAGDVREQMTIFMRGTAGIRAMEGLAATFHDMAESVTALADRYAPEPDETPRASAEARRRNRGDRPRFF